MSTWACVRLYDPWAGVWLTREPLPAQAREPRTWHRYGYAYARPNGGVFTIRIVELIRIIAD